MVVRTNGRGTAKTPVTLSEAEQLRIGTSKVPWALLQSSVVVQRAGRTQPPPRSRSLQPHHRLAMSSQEVPPIPAGSTEQALSELRSSIARHKGGSQAEGLAYFDCAAKQMTGWFAHPANKDNGAFRRQRQPTDCQIAATRLLATSRRPQPPTRQAGQSRSAHSPGSSYRDSASESKQSSEQAVSALYAPQCEVRHHRTAGNYRQAGIANNRAAGNYRRSRPFLAGPHTARPPASGQSAGSAAGSAVSHARRSRPLSSTTRGSHLRTTQRPEPKQRPYTARLARTESKELEPYQQLQRFMSTSSGEMGLGVHCTLMEEEQLGFVKEEGETETARRDGYTRKHAGRRTFGSTAGQYD